MHKSLQPLHHAEPSSFMIKQIRLQHKSFLLDEIKARYPNSALSGPKLQHVKPDRSST